MDAAPTLSAPPDTTALSGPTARKAMEHTLAFLDRLDDPSKPGPHGAGVVTRTEKKALRDDVAGALARYMEEHRLRTESQKRERDMAKRKAEEEERREKERSSRESPGPGCYHLFLQASSGPLVRVQIRGTRHESSGGGITIYHGYREVACFPSVAGWGFTQHPDEALNSNDIDTPLRTKL